MTTKRRNIVWFWYYNWINNLNQWKRNYLINLFVYRALGWEKAGMPVDRYNKDQEPLIQFGEGLAQYCLIFRDFKEDFFSSVQSPWLIVLENCTLVKKMWTKPSAVQFPKPYTWISLKKKTLYLTKAKYCSVRLSLFKR